MRRRSPEGSFQSERQLRTFGKEENRQQRRDELAQQLVELRKSGNRKEAKRQRALYYDNLQQQFERAEYNEEDVRRYFFSRPSLQDNHGGI